MIKDDYDIFEQIDNKYLIVDWAPLNLCNFSCTYCHHSNYDGSNTPHSIEDCKRFVDYISTSTDKLLYFNINGGEPTLWRHLDEFCEYVKSKNTKNIIRLITNGTRGENWWLARTHLIDQIIVSIHNGQTKNQEIVEKFNAFYKTGSDVSLHLMMDILNFDTCVETYEYCKQYLDGPSMIVRPLRTDISQIELQPYTQDQIEKMKKMRPLRRNAHHPQQSEMAWKSNSGKLKRVFDIERQLLLPKENNWRDWYCYIGIETIVVNSFGNIKIGSQCFKYLNFGDISDTTYALPMVPIKCKYDFCSCLTDLQTKKTKDLKLGEKYIDAELHSPAYKITTRN